MKNIIFNKCLQKIDDVFKYYLVFIAALSLLACDPYSSSSYDEKDNMDTVEWDLADVKKTGKLRAITTYSSTSYFLYKGQAMGFEYELLESFAKYLDVELVIVVANNIDDLLVRLNKGDADIVAHGLAITKERKELVRFTNSLYLTKQVLVQKKPDNWLNMHWKDLDNALIKDAVELIGDTVSVRAQSSYMTRLQNLSFEIGGDIVIDTLMGTETTDAAIEKVVNGEVKYTVADNNIAKVFATYYPILDIEVPISFSQRIAWATRHHSPALEMAINEWLASIKKEAFYNVVYNKYFKNKKDFRKRVKSEFYSLNTNVISPYDVLIKKHAARINWDWRLLASLIYQESGFNVKENSWVGAVGLMQLMLTTANELGVTDRYDPSQNIEGGTRYLSQLYDAFNEVPDSIQRIKFAMASYNCGKGHVYDAQRLAIAQGLNPKVWDGSVEDIIIKLQDPKYFNAQGMQHGYVRGSEPYGYVQQIFDRFEHYKQFIKE